METKITIQYSLESLYDLEKIINKYGNLTFDACSSDIFGTMVLTTDHCPIYVSSEIWDKKGVYSISYCNPGADPIVIKGKIESEKEQKRFPQAANRL